MMQKLTVFTPTYNRRHILNKLYESLKSQTFKDFIWLLVDDGSTDNTQEIVDKWISEGYLHIEYYYQNNQGKHAAHNTGVLHCKTEYFFCVDSDDYLPSDSLENIIQKFEQSNISERIDIAGLIAKRGYSLKNPISINFPIDVKEASIKELYKKYETKGDLAIIFKTKILREYLFPIFDGEIFVTEGIVYNQISMKYKMVLLGEIIYLGEYLDDGYSRNIIDVHRRNPNGYISYLEQELELAADYYETKIARANYLAGCWIVKKKPKLDKIAFIESFPKAIIIFIKTLAKSTLMKNKTGRDILNRYFKTRI